MFFVLGEACPVYKYDCILEMKLLGYSVCDYHGDMIGCFVLHVRFGWSEGEEIVISEDDGYWEVCWQ